jgi:hypothetical protein
MREVFVDAKQKRRRLKLNATGPPILPDKTTDTLRPGGGTFDALFAERLRSTPQVLHRLHTMESSNEDHV